MPRDRFARLTSWALMSGWVSPSTCTKPSVNVSPRRSSCVTRLRREISGERAVEGSSTTPPSRNCLRRVLRRLIQLSGGGAEPVAHAAYGLDERAVRLPAQVVHVGVDGALLLPAVEHGSEELLSGEGHIRGAGEHLE